MIYFADAISGGGRGQALDFFQHLATNNAVAWSGGSEPGNQINPATVAATDRPQDSPGEASSIRHVREPITPRQTSPAQQIVAVYG